MATPTLSFLADESCEFGVVRALRRAGYDVLAVSEVTTRSDDRQLIEQAAGEGRILLTEDKDFGWLVFVSQVASPGVILIRFPGDARQTLAGTIVQVVQEQGERLIGAFVVVQPGYIRIGRQPGTHD
jgi:predicted nuclease of predicted toxin-antitoxin system